MALKCATCDGPLSSINDPCPQCLPGFYGRVTRPEAAAIASVTLDAEDTWEEPWRCEACGCHSRAFMDERQPDGRYAPGQSFRCVNCKRETIVPDYKAAVRDLATAVQSAVDDYYIASGKMPTPDGDGYGSLRQCRLAIEKHAAAIAAARGDT